MLRRMRHQRVLLMCSAVVVLALCAAPLSADAATKTSGAAASPDCSRLPGCTTCAEMTPEEWQAARKAWLATRATAKASGHPVVGATTRPSSTGRKLMDLLRGYSGNSTKHARLHSDKKPLIKTDIFKAKPPLKCVKCAGTEYELKDHRCGELRIRVAV